MFNLRKRSPHLTLRKIAIWLSKNCQKLDIFSKQLPKIVIFSKKLPIAFLKKERQFRAIFFYIQMAIFWRVRKVNTSPWQRYKCEAVFVTLSNLRLHDWGLAEGSDTGVASDSVQLRSDAEMSNKVKISFSSNGLVS